MLNIKIIIGSTRPKRFSEKPAKWIFERAKNRFDIEVELLDLREYPLPFFNEPAPPTQLNGNYSDEIVRRWAKKIIEADAFVMVTPEYNHGYSAVLKNAIDSIYPEWNNKPVGFVSYGSVGGARAVEQLRQVAVEVQMAPIREAIHIPWKTYMEVLESKSLDPLNSFNEKADMFLDQLVEWGDAMKSKRLGTLVKEVKK